MNRRDFLWTITATAAAARVGALGHSNAGTTEIALTMDDPKPDALAGTSGDEINHRILHTLSAAGIKASLFVCGMRIDSPAGSAILRPWDAAGHEICNHTYSHRFYNSPNVSYEDYAADFLRDEPLIRGYKHFKHRFRFAFLKEGDTAEKRDRFRALLKEHGYSIGHVTVDASDWYVDQRMRKRLEKDSKADTVPYRDYYIAHMLERARYYRQLSRECLGHDVRHTILVHHNLLNALYLPDMMSALRGDGWKWVDAAHAFRDPVFNRQPHVVPAGESLIWALAKESGRFEDRLRYPGEDDVYEKARMDSLDL